MMSDAASADDRALLVSPVAAPEGACDCPEPTGGRLRRRGRKAAVAAIFATALALTAVRARSSGGIRGLDLRHLQGLSNASITLSPAEDRGLRKWVLPKSVQHDCAAEHGGNSCWRQIAGTCAKLRDGPTTWAVIRDLAVVEGVPSRSDAPFDPLLRPEVCDRPEAGLRTSPWTDEQSGQARAWFDANVKVYVLNMPGDAARWERIQGRLQALGLTATRVAGVDLQRSTGLGDAVAEGIIPRTWNSGAALAAARGTDIGLGTVGSTAGHFRVLDKIIADDVPMGLVLEDDANLADDFVERLWGIVQEELPEKWDILSLQTACPYGECISPHLFRVQTNGNEVEELCHSGVNLAATALLHRAKALPRLQRLWKAAVFSDPPRPACLDAATALSRIASDIAYFAVPSVQNPGLVKTFPGESSRRAIDEGPVP